MRRLPKFTATAATLFVSLNVVGQTYTTVSTAFTGGGGTQPVGAYTLTNVIGQSIVGSEAVGTGTNAGGFLLQYAASVGPPENTGVFSVTTDADTGEGSLRWGILSANTTAGLNVIRFNIPGGGVHTIAPAAELPLITEPVIIDGYSQPGSQMNTNPPAAGTNAVLLIELNGMNSGGDGCVQVRATGCTIRGLVINRSPGPGIRLRVGGNNVVEGNFLGTDPSGNVAMGNQYGVAVDYDDNDRIGGSTPATRNLISGNVVAGVAIGTGGLVGGDGHIIQGNLIGTNAGGTAPLANPRGVVLAWNTNNVLIGGTSPGSRNVISGNTLDGVSISAALGLANVSHNRVTGNFIGTDVSGISAVGNGQDGVSVFGLHNFVGGRTPEERNIIAGNGRDGVHIFSGDSSVVQGNYIGTDVTGSLPLGNHGVGVYLTAYDVAVGGRNAGEGNIIAFNGTNPLAHAGVGLVGASARNAILGNAIYSNTGLGIDLGNGSALDGVTPNDPCDTDSLIANDLQNTPVLLSAESNGTTITVSGALDSKPGGVYRIEFFRSQEADSTGSGEGHTFVGTIEVTTDGSCTATFLATLPGSTPAGDVISATATDIAGNTSEFSVSIPIGTTSAGEPEPVPGEFALFQNYPNPFNPTTNVEFRMKNAGNVSVRVYDLLGREVAVIVNEHRPAGFYRERFDASRLSSGVYFYRLTAGGDSATRRLILLR